MLTGRLILKDRRLRSKFPFRRASAFSLRMPHWLISPCVSRTRACPSAVSTAGFFVRSKSWKPNSSSKEEIRREAFGNGNDKASAARAREPSLDVSMNNCQARIRSNSISPEQKSKQRNFLFGRKPEGSTFVLMTDRQSPFYRFYLHVCITTRRSSFVQVIDKFRCT